MHYNPNVVINANRKKNIERKYIINSEFKGNHQSIVVITIDILFPQQGTNIITNNQIDFI